MSDALQWKPISLPRIHQIEQILNVELSFHFFYLVFRSLIIIILIVVE